MKRIFVKSLKSEVKNLSSQEGRYISNMGKLLLFSIFILFFLSSIKSVLSVEIVSCKSGAEDGVCEKYNECICTISSQCTNGNLLVYQRELNNPLCSPEIVGNSVSIGWYSCNITQLLFVNVRADCDEGQSAEKTIKLFVLETTTVSETTTTPPIETTTLEEETTTTVTDETANTCGVNGHCEDSTTDESSETVCQGGYEYCPEYNEECPDTYNEICCCEKNGGPDFTFIILIGLAVMVGIIVLLFFITRMKKDTSFKKLYKKWNR